MGEISAASTEQSAGVAQVGEAISQMDKATQQNAALVEESAAAAEGLKAQAQQMVQAVAVFKLSAQTELAPTAQTTSSDAKAKLPPSQIAVPVLNREVAASTTERRGPDRAKNVTRPDFSAKSNLVTPTARAAAIPNSQSTGKTGTDEWESF
jgi:methyl-accepting chemotaxis protein